MGSQGFFWYDAMNLKYWIATALVSVAFIPSAFGAPIGHAGGATGIGGGVRAGGAGGFGGGFHPLDMPHGGGISSPSSPHIGGGVPSLGMPRSGVGISPRMFGAPNSPRGPLGPGIGPVPHIGPVTRTPNIGGYANHGGRSLRIEGPRQGTAMPHVAIPPTTTGHATGGPPRQPNVVGPTRPGPNRFAASPALRDRTLVNPVFSHSRDRNLSQSRFQGRFADHTIWHHRHRGIVIGWYGPLFWPYIYADLFEYSFWPYAYDDFGMAPANVEIGDAALLALSH